MPVLGTVLAAVKCVFVGIQVDEEYAISMAGRLLQVDKLFAQLWDPHQTSAFLAAGMLWIYKGLFHTWAGAIIWVRALSTLIHAAAAFGVYRMLRHYTTVEFSFYLGLLYFNILPKGYMTPEFANMLVWSVTFLLLSLSGWERKGGAWPLVSAGVWMSLAVLSYPSAVLIFPLVVVYLWSKGDRRAALIFGVVCLVCGGAYLGYLFSYMEPANLWMNLEKLLEGNSGHSWNGKMGRYLLQTGSAVVLTGIYAAIAGVLLRVVKAGKCKKGFVFLILVLMVGVAHQILHWVCMLHEYEYSYIYTIYFALFVGAWLVGRKYRELRGLLILWVGGSLVMFVAVLLLTVLNIYTSIRYATPGLIVALLVLVYAAERKEGEEKGRCLGLLRLLILLWCFASIFIKGWEYRDDAGRMENITSVRAVMSEGPGKGLLTQYMQSYIQENTCDEFEQYVKPGDKVFLLADGTLGYLYEDVCVSSYTTICGAIYNESLLYYWEQNPEKYPDIVIVPCWYGELKWNPESWIMQWVVNEFEAEQVIDGKYFRYYIGAGKDQELETVVGSVEGNKKIGCIPDILCYN